ncbi:MAG: hypothetical protein ACRCZF_06755 [Gemmataceae bacterium]
MRQTNSTRLLSIVTVAAVRPAVRGNDTGKGRGRDMHQMQERLNLRQSPRPWSLSATPCSECGWATTLAKPANLSLGYRSEKAMPQAVDFARG